VEDNIKMDIKALVCDDADCFRVAQDRAVVDMQVELVFQEAGFIS
jgi:hypothetical protein